MIPVFLNAGYRVVAPDFIGFGRSDKITNVDNYSHKLHVGTLLALIQSLNLEVNFCNNVSFSSISLK